MRLFVTASIISVTTCLAACGGDGSPGPAPSTPSAPAADDATGQVIDAMLSRLTSTIAGFLSDQQSALPRNPHSEAWILAKIALLQDPGLANAITAGRLYVSGSTRSSNGQSVPIVAVFPAEGMRGEAMEMVQRGGLTLPQLEEFLGITFAPRSVQIWYGFTVGSSGGGGTLNLEDRTTFTARTAVRPAVALYDAILDHELAHTWFGHESLTGFLEILVYNRIATGSFDASVWPYTKGQYTPFSRANTGWLALIDVYQLLGRDAMGRAYGAAWSLRPPYGVPLSAECRQRFVDQAPAGERERVAAILERVTY